MPRLTRKTAMWFWLIFGGIFGGIFAAFAISIFLSAFSSEGLTSTVRFVAAVVSLAISAFYFRNAWKAYRDGRIPK